MGAIIEIKARVDDLIPNEMRDQYHSGTVVTFDAIVLKVLEPAALKNRDLRLYHEHPVPDDSPWRRAGRVRFLIDTDLLEGEQQLFAGAASELRMIDAK